MGEKTFNGMLKYLFSQHLLYSVLENFFINTVILLQHLIFQMKGSSFYVSKHIIPDHTQRS